MSSYDGRYGRKSERWASQYPYACHGDVRRYQRRQSGTGSDGYWCVCGGPIGPARRESPTETISRRRSVHYKKRASRRYRRP